MAREYNFVVIQFKGKHRPILCHRSKKCSALVAIANMSFLQEGEVNPKNPPPHVDPQVLTESIVGELKEVISGLQRETTLYDQAKGKEKILEKIAGSLDSPVTLDPVNNSCFEFNQTDELLVMTILDVPILHGWVLDKKDTHLDFVKGVSRSNFRTKLAEAEQRNSSDALRKELNDFMNARITTYGLACLHEAIGEGGLAILYDNNGYHVVCKDGGDLFTLETNEEVVTQLPNAVWKKLSIEENKSFHVTSSFTPTHGQPKEKQELADEWILTALDYKPTRNKKNKDKKPESEGNLTEDLEEDKGFACESRVPISAVCSTEDVSASKEPKPPTTVDKFLEFLSV